MLVSSACVAYYYVGSSTSASLYYPITSHLSKISYYNNKHTYNIPNGAPTADPNAKMMLTSPW